MYKLNRSRLITLLLWLVACISLPSFARGEDFCALTLHVYEPTGIPIKSTWIELDNSSGKVVRNEMIGSTLKICDFGFGPHTLRVGTNECLPVTISNLRMIFGSPLDLRVVLNGCGYRETVRSACLLYVRVIDAGGTPIPDVDFSPNLVLDRSPRTDSFGRYQSLVSGNRELIFTKEGFEAERVRVQCKGTEEVDVEVTMKRPSQ